MTKPGPKPIWTDERLDELADQMDAYYEANPQEFTLEAFCAENRLWPQRITEFAQKNTRIAEALKVAKNHCALQLARKTAAGLMPPAFGIFGLKNNGWSDKQEIEHSGQVGITSLAQALSDA